MATPPPELISRVTIKLRKLFKDDGFDMTNVTDKSSLYAAPFGFNKQSLQVWINGRVNNPKTLPFGVPLKVRVVDLSDPPTFGSLRDEIVRQIMAQKKAPRKRTSRKPRNAKK